MYCKGREEEVRQKGGEYRTRQGERNVRKERPGRKDKRAVSEGGKGDFLFSNIPQEVPQGRPWNDLICSNPVLFLFSPILNPTYPNPYRPPPPLPTDPLI